MGKKHTITVPGRYDEIQQVCRFVAAGATQSGLDETAVFHIELACDEACTNIIEHAYGGEGVGEILISWQVKKNDFVITLHDHGRRFDPTAVPPPSLATDETVTETEMLENLKVGGLGVHFIRQLMDEVHFHFDDNGNELVLVKKVRSG